MTSRADLLVGTLVLALVSVIAAAQAAQEGAAITPARSALVEGRPVDSRPTEKRDNTPEFAGQTRAPYHATKPYTITTLVDGITAPWSLAFLPGGDMLITERLPGKMRLRHADGRLSAPLGGLEVLRSADAADIGLLDVVLDPAFATNHRIFFTFYDYVGGTNSNTCVARARLDEATLRVNDVTVIFHAEPRIPSKRLGGKTGGRLVFSSDGHLFLTIGDRSDSPPWDVAQRLDTHLGKVLRITRDGAPAPDNPFLNRADVRPEIWAYGIRSPEGFAITPDGTLWETEHGPRGGDELNIIRKGRNYGWPLIAHGIDYAGGPMFKGQTAMEGMEQPIYYWDPVIAPSGLAYYNGRLFPEWRGSLLAGGLRGVGVYRLQLKNNKVVAEEPLLTELKTRIRDVRVGPDGAVYVLTEQKALLKLTPQ